MDSHQYYDRVFTFSVWRGFWAGHRALGLIIVGVIVLLLSGGGWRLGWRR